MNVVDLTIVENLLRNIYIFIDFLKKIAFIKCVYKNLQWTHMLLVRELKKRLHKD